MSDFALSILPTLASSTWAITPQAFHALVALGKQETGAEQRQRAADARSGQYLAGTNVQVRGSVGILAIDGPLTRVADCWWCACSYDEIARDIRAAVDDASIRALVLAMNSPGGDVNGMLDVSEQIFAARAEKPIIAVGAGLAASAGYLLAAAASRVVIAPNAEMGSIGVFCTLWDWSGLLEKFGIKEYVFTSRQSPNKNPDPATADGAAQYQAIVDAHGEIVITHVAKYRGVTPDVVLSEFGKGGLFVGADAVKAGLADDVGFLDHVVAELQAPSATFSTQTSRTGGRMAKNQPASVKALAGGDKVTINVSRDIAVAEGDQGTVGEVREGVTAVSVEGPNGSYLWLLSDEIGAASASPPPEQEPAARDAALDARVTARYPQTIGRVQQAAAAAERARIVGIQRLTPVGQTELAEQCIAEGLSVEASARRLLEAQNGAARTRAVAFVTDDARVTAPAAATPAPETDSAAANARSVVAAMQKANARNN